METPESVNWSEAIPAAAKCHKCCSPLAGAMLQLFVILVLGSYLCSSIYSPAFFGHLTIGHWIVSSFEVPSVNLWTLAGSGAQWKSESWLFELLLAQAEHFFGERGLVIIKLLLFFGVTGVLSWCYSSRSKDFFFGTAVACIVSCGALLGACLEAQTVGFLYFILVLEISYRLQDASSSKGLFAAFFLLAASYANVAASALGALIVLAFFVCRGGGTFSFNRRALFIALIFFLAQLVSPYSGAQLLSVAKEVCHSLSLALNLQSNPATVYSYPAAFLFLLLVVLGFFWHYSPRGLEASELLLLASVSCLGLAEHTYLPYALIIAGLNCALIWGRADANSLGNLGLGLLHLKRQLAKIPPLGLLWVLLCLVIVNVAGLLKAPMTNILLPAAEMDYVLEQKLAFPILHESAVGPYLQYRLANAQGELRQLPSITPRTAVLAPELARAEAKLRDLQPGWEDYFRLLNPRTVICRRQTPIYEVLKRDNSWELAFERGPYNGWSGKGLSLSFWAVFRKKEG